jgi:hypothetical protein
LAISVISIVVMVGVVEVDFLDEGMQFVFEDRGDVL